VREPIRLGIAGWSYPDWEGIVYTGRIRDRLEFVSRYVDVVEINSTFYRPPDPRNVGAWVRRTAGRRDFRFTAKLHQDVTHGRRIEPAMVDAFRVGLAPAAEAGRLSHILAQFRWDFADGPQGRAHLRAIRDAFGGIAEIVTEVRHASWQSPEALAFLAEIGVTVANLDFPLSRTAFSLRECRVGRNGYLRLHGRNRAAWFDKDAGRDATYDYLYSPAEVREIADRAVALSGFFRSLTVIANNHFRGKEVANALELKALLGGTKVPVPPGLLAEYPRLAAIAAPEDVLGG
jgi:uncharacterized protein YecE (DUF72 family)